MITFSLWSNNKVDSLLKVLDTTLERSSYYEGLKNERLSKIRVRLNNKNLSLNKQYEINNLLFNEYEAYNYDSAMNYVNINLQIAALLKNDTMTNECFLKKTRLLSISGIYAEGMKIIESINKTTLNKNQMQSYYLEFKNLYLYQAEYTSGSEFRDNYLHKMNLYLDSALLVLPHDTYHYTTIKVSLLINNQKYTEAEALLIDFLKKTSSGTREHSILTSILAFLYSFDNRIELQKEYLIRSAISDIKAVVKENNSIRTLGEILYEEGDTERAYNYLKKSMDDANYFNARLRNLQSSKMLSIINKKYLSKKIEQQKRTQRLLIIISMLSIFLLIAVIYAIHQMKKLSRTRKEVQNINIELQKLNAELSKANNRLNSTNLNLKESNIIKDEYLGRFLDLCSKYIDNLENYRKMLNKKAGTGKIEDLLKILKSTKYSDDELKDLYFNFDSAFLKIFPNFVDSFNKLLPESEQIIPKNEEQLTTELRIYALIRLGITESGQIAKFLRFSITTIYSYRSKMRVRSLYKNNFEEQVLKIGTF